MKAFFQRGLFSRRTLNIVRASRVIGLVSMGLFVSASFIGIGLVVGAKYGDQIPVVKEIEQERQVVRELAGRDSSGPLDAMAIRIAELTAQIIRLEAITQRILNSSDLPQAQISLETAPGRGGLNTSSGHSVGFDELQDAIDDLSAEAAKQADVLSLLDTDLQSARVRLGSRPSERPVFDATLISSFGTRIDPFTGRRSRHEGVDFVASRGNPILAAADGVVLRSGYNSGYGYMIDIEHADKVVTRYAHASKLLVKKGDKVRMGQEIAKVGSTGRSTGPHLHFEVRVNGVPKDPRKFLEKHGLPGPGPATLTALNGLLDEHH